jgi:hypothetical protein
MRTMQWVRQGKVRAYILSAYPSATRFHLYYNRRCEKDLYESLSLVHI